MAHTDFMLTPFWLGLYGLAGLLAGSFLNVLIHRLPRMILAHEAGTPLPGYGLAWPRSHCPHCGHALAWHELVPLLSFVWQGARCRHCRARIAWTYPLVEAACAALFLWQVFMRGPGAASLAWALMLSALLALCVIDARTRLLPDALTLPLLAGGLLASALGLTGLSPGASLLGAILGYASFRLVAWAYERWRGRVGLGGGDVKLLAALGAWLGAERLPALVWLAALMGLLLAALLKILRRWPEDGYIPLGPALALASVLVGTPFVAHRLGL